MSDAFISKTANASVTTFVNRKFECPVHGVTENYISSYIPGHEGFWCQICWIESFARTGVSKITPLSSE